MSDCNGNLHSSHMWTPNISPSKLQICHFMKSIEEKYKVCLNGDYWACHKWSCKHYPEFWEEVLHFTEVVYSEPYERVVDREKNVSNIPIWFRGLKLNYAENILAKGKDDDVALYFAGEKTNGRAQKMTFRELRRRVDLYAGALKNLGVTKGDRVAGYLPNCFEAVIAMLATASIGAVWSSSSPDFGVSGVLDRLSQVEPKILFTVEAVRYNGKRHDHLEKVAQVVQKLHKLELVIIIPFLNDDQDMIEMDLSNIPKSMLMSEFMAVGEAKHDGDGHNLSYTQVAFHDPLFIMFSSGTTGPPKCMVHSVGGTLLKHLAEHVLQLNIGRGDVMFFYTTAGWMMWNWLVTALATGAAVVLYDGSPFVPHPAILFDLVDAIKITSLGMGAKCYSVLESKNVRPKMTHHLHSLKSVLSTGSTLKPQSFDYVYTWIKSDLLVGSISGGTDIIACFMGASWLLPVHRGEIQCPLLGCDLANYDEDGTAVLDKRGELVVLKPFPSMPTGFLNDPDGLLYRKAYFSKYPKVWAHGDYCLFNSKTGGILMLGRSDGTLNPGGVRFGSAEIYHVVESIPGVLDSLCVSQPLAHTSDERVILFLKMKPGHRCDERFAQQVSAIIRQQLSAKHVPAIVLPIDDIPYTNSGKKVEIAVKRILAGEGVTNRSALANPDSLELYMEVNKTLSGQE